MSHTELLGRWSPWVSTMHRMCAAGALKETTLAATSRQRWGGTATTAADDSGEHGTASVRQNRRRVRSQ